MDVLSTSNASDRRARSSRLGHIPLPFLTLGHRGRYVFETRRRKLPDSYVIATMRETITPSSIVSAARLCGLGVTIFTVGAVLGYFRGAFGDGGTTEQGFDWAVKTGLLSVAMVAALGLLGGFILSKIQLPSYIHWALLMGLAFAIQNGGGVLLGMNEKEFWRETISGFLMGALVGAIAGPIILRNLSRRIQKTLPNSETVSDRKTT